MKTLNLFFLIFLIPETKAMEAIELPPSQLERRNATHNLFATRNNNLIPFPKLLFRDSVFKALCNYEVDPFELFKTISKESTIKEKRNTCAKIIGQFDTILKMNYMFTNFNTDTNYNIDHINNLVYQKVAYTLNYFFEKGVSPNWENKKKHNFLNLAIKNNNPWIVTFVLSKITKQIIESTLNFSVRNTRSIHSRKNIHYEFLKSICLDR